MAKGNKTKKVVETPTVTDTGSSQVATTNPHVTFTKKNYMIMVGGVLLMALGYLLMVGGATDDPTVFNAAEKYSFVRITLSPILIIAGLALQVPGIMMRFNN